MVRVTFIFMVHVEMPLLLPLAPLTKWLHQLLTKMEELRGMGRWSNLGAH